MKRKLKTETKQKKNKDKMAALLHLQTNGSAGRTKEKRNSVFKKTLTNKTKRFLTKKVPYYFRKNKM